MKILIVEDEADLLEQLQKRLRSDGYQVECAATYTSARDKLFDYDYALLIADINLPDGTGLDLIKQANELKPDLPIIIISARNTVNNKIEGLELGADDYLTKPFDMAELSARVKSVIRRWNFGGSNIKSYGTLSMDINKQMVWGNGIPLDLTRTEYNLLHYFFSNPNRVLTRDSIAEHIWGDHMDMADSFDFLYTHMKNLRKKITSSGADNPIKAVYGVGYKLVTKE
jgi:DNA-binding response OmpR family regulator